MADSLVEVQFAQVGVGNFNAQCTLSQLGGPAIKRLDGGWMGALDLNTQSTHCSSVMLDAISDLLLRLQLDGTIAALTSALFVDVSSAR